MDHSTDRPIECEQLVFMGLEEPDYKKLAPKATQLLRRYKRSLQNIKSLKAQLKNGMFLVFDSGTASYGESVRGYSEYTSSTERNVLSPMIKLEEKIANEEAFCQSVETLIQLLPGEDQKLLLARYVYSKPKTDFIEPWLVEHGIHVGRSQFYEQANLALKKFIVITEHILESWEG